MTKECKDVDVVVAGIGVEQEIVFESPTTIEIGVLVSKGRSFQLVQIEPNITGSAECNILSRNN